LHHTLIPRRRRQFIAQSAVFAASLEAAFAKVGQSQLVQYDALGVAELIRKRYPLISVEFCQSAEVSVLDTTNFCVLFIWSAMPPDWPPKAAANPS